MNHKQLQMKLWWKGFWKFANRDFFGGNFLKWITLKMRKNRVTAKEGWEGKKVVSSWDFVIHLNLREFKGIKNSFCISLHYAWALLSFMTLLSISYLMKAFKVVFKIPREMFTAEVLSLKKFFLISATQFFFIFEQLQFQKPISKWFLGNKTNMNNN